MTHLAVLEQEKLLHVWSDNQISAGDDWYPRIQKAMDDSRVAVLLVSPDYLASKFIRSEEVPRLLQLHAENGMLFLPLIARSSAWKLVPWLSRVQVRPKNGMPLAMGTGDQIDADLAAFTYEVASLIERFKVYSSPTVERACSEFDKAMSRIQDTNEEVNDTAVATLLALAIEHGAPAYNNGTPINCTRIYRYAASSLLKLLHSCGSSSSQRGVREAQRLLPDVIPEEDDIDEKNADELAWKFRDTFDRILDASTSNLTRWCT